MPPPSRAPDPVVDPARHDLGGGWPVRQGCRDPDVSLVGEGGGRDASQSATMVWVLPHAVLESENGLECKVKDL